MPCQADDDWFAGHIYTYMYVYIYIYLVEGSLEVKLPTIWTDEKQSRAEAERREKIRREKSRRERVRRKKMQMREKVGKSQNIVWFPLYCGSGGSKGRLAKAAGAEPAGQMRDEKLHAAVARSTFPSQNVRSTSASDHFWKLRCRKSARRCGAKRISKSKCTKHTRFRPLLEVEMSKKRTPLWREAHFKVKMYKTQGVRTTFGGSDVASRGKRKGLCTLSKVSKTSGFCSIFHCTTLHSNTLHSITFNYTQLHSITPNYITLHYTTLHSATLHYITLHYTTFHYTALHYTTLHYTTLHSTTLHYTTLHYTTFHYTSLHYTTLRSTTLQLQLHNYTPLHSTTLHPLHSTTLNYTPLH